METARGAIRALKGIFLQDEEATQEMFLNFEKFKISLPEGHNLISFQKKHPLYDRFLTHLAAEIPTGAGVVDVGANVGDTIAAIISANPSLRILGIEADDEFFDNLLSNIQRILGGIPLAEISAVKELVGRGNHLYALEGEGGTKHAVPSENGSALSKSLDVILESHGFGAVTLLKVDTDGFDWDVVASAQATIRKWEPVLFLEIQHDSNDQVAQFKSMFKSLERAGYSTFSAFDNFGGPILESNDAGAILHLIDYIQRQNRRETTRSIYYLDVLCATPKHGVWVKRAMDSF